MSKRDFAPESDVLGRVSVRLIHEAEERPRFDQHLEQEHYLHSARLGGQSLRYVAELDGQWVALISFSAPALHIKARDMWIGWTPRQRARRLALVVNNSRFLVLAQRERYPNLASRVLGLCLKRLSRDWQEKWEHPVLLVESFVDESKYRGTCYRACGFQALGMTSGYGRNSRDFYTEHGQPKQLYVRELRPQAAAILQRGRLPTTLAEYEEEISGPCPLRAAQLRSLLKFFQEIGDSRQGHGLRHRQPYVLACACVAMLMGAGSYQGFEDICSKLTQRQLKALGARKDPKTKAYRAPSGLDILWDYQPSRCPGADPRKEQRDSGPAAFTQKARAAARQRDYRRCLTLSAKECKIHHSRARSRLPHWSQRQPKWHLGTSPRKVATRVFFPLNTIQAFRKLTDASNAINCNNWP